MVICGIPPRVCGGLASDLAVPRHEEWAAMPMWGERPLPILSYRTPAPGRGATSSDVPPHIAYASVLRHRIRSRRGPDDSRGVEFVMRSPSVPRGSRWGGARRNGALSAPRSPMRSSPRPVPDAGALPRLRSRRPGAGAASFAASPCSNYGNYAVRVWDPAMSRSGMAPWQGCPAGVRAPAYDRTMRWTPGRCWRCPFDPAPCSMPTDSSGKLFLQA
jgi:hypothetical protein